MGQSSPLPIDMQCYRAACDKLKPAGLNLKTLTVIFHAVVASVLYYPLAAWYGHLLQSDIGRINALFRKTHRWQLTEELGEEADIKLLGPLMGTLHTSHTNYYLHTDQLNIHYENGVTRSSYPPSIQHTLDQYS